MFYQLLVVAVILAVVSFFGIKRANTQAIQIKAASVFVFSLTTSVLLTGVCFISIMTASTVSNYEYKNVVAANIPKLEGSFSCDGTELRFKGTQSVAFTYENQKHSVDYPVDLTVSRLTTYCPLEIKASATDTTKVLTAHSKVLSARIEHMLRTKQVSTSVTNHERAFQYALLKAYTEGGRS